MYWIHSWFLHIWQLCLFAKVAGWAELDLSVSEWAAIIVGVVCLWILISVVLACFCGPDFVTCHLCQQQGSQIHIPFAYRVTRVVVHFGLVDLKKFRMIHHVINLFME